MYIFLVYICIHVCMCVYIYIYLFIYSVFLYRYSAKLAIQLSTLHHQLFLGFTLLSMLKVKSIADILHFVQVSRFHYSQ